MPGKTLTPGQKKGLALGRVLARMQDFMHSKYDGESFATEKEFFAAKTSTDHWLKTIKKELDLK